MGARVHARREALNASKAFNIRNGGTKLKQIQNELAELCEAAITGSNLTSQTESSSIADDSVSEEEKHNELSMVMDNLTDEVTETLDNTVETVELGQQKLQEENLVDSSKVVASMSLTDFMSACSISP